MNQACVSVRFSIWLCLLLVLYPSPARSKDYCQSMRLSWEDIQSYVAVFHAQSFEKDRLTEKEILYSFQKPDKIRMDMIQPHRGTVLIYNPEVSEKVRIKFSRWFPRLSYPLHHRRVSTDKGSTINESHVGAWINQLCEDMADSQTKLKGLAEKEESSVTGDVTKKSVISFELYRQEPFLHKRVILSGENMPVHLDIYDVNGNIVESSWLTSFEVNPVHSENTFKKFAKRKNK